MPNSLDIDGRAGATIEDDTGEMKVKDDTTIVAAHFLLNVQFLGSSGPSQDTWRASQPYSPFYKNCGHSFAPNWGP